MRPSRPLITLAALWALASLGIGLALPEGGAGLVLALWVVLVALALVDLAVTPSARQLQVSADLPQAGFVGRDATLTLDIARKSGDLPPRMALRLAADPLVTLAGDTAHITANGSATRVQLALQLRGRGNARLTRFWLSYPSRFGLFQMLPHWPLDLALRIEPDTHPVSNGEIMTQMLPLLDGHKSMRLKGQGSEFHQLREFQPDMDPRMIDWKRSARQLRMVARETRAERNHQIVLALDSGHLMSVPMGRMTRFDLSLNAALALAWAGGLGGDNVGFYTFGSRPGQFIPPRPGRDAFGLIRRRAADLFPEAAQTNHTLGLTHLNGRLTRRSLVVVFSDFSDSVTVELMVENLSVITHQHLVLFIALRDPDLDRIAEARPPATGTQTGTQTGTDLNTIAEAIAARAMRRERREVLDRLTRMGVLCLDTTPQMLTTDLISRYIDIKAEEKL